MVTEKARGTITELREEQTLFSYMYGIAKWYDLKLDMRTGQQTTLQKQWDFCVHENNNFWCKKTGKLLL
jgi:hypothetical protein